jgi:hypothetical protein
MDYWLDPDNQETIERIKFYRKWNCIKKGDTRHYLACLQENRWLTDRKLDDLMEKHRWTWKRTVKEVAHFTVFCMAIGSISYQLSSIRCGSTGDTSYCASIVIGFLSDYLLYRLKN